MNWYAKACSLLVAFIGFLWGYDIGSVNGVKEMPGYRAALNISYSLLLADDNNTGQCTSSDDVETSAILGIVVTILHIGCLFGALISGVLSDVAGRKVAIITGTLTCIVGVALHVGTINIWMALIGRLFDGFGVGILYQVGPLYIAELSPKKIRGRLISFIAIVSVFGILFGNTLNAFTKNYWFGWRITLVVKLLAASVVAIGTLFVPETPRWLVKKGRHAKALNVLKRVHQHDLKALHDLKEIKASVNNATKMKTLDTVKFFFCWNILQRVLIGFFLHFFGRLNGGVFIVYYSVTLFCHVGINGFTASIALLICMVIAQIAGMTIVDKAGRKAILLISGLFLSVFSLLVATIIFLFDLDDPPDEGLYKEQFIAGILIVILIILFMCTYNVSYGNIPFVVNSEIFPLQIRSIAVAITSTGWWGGTIVLNELSAVLLSSALGSYGTFYFIAGGCILTNIFVILLIPETKNKSLEEIEILFKKPWYKRINLQSNVWCWITLCGCHKYWSCVNCIQSQGSHELFGSRTSTSTDSESTDNDNSNHNQFDAVETRL